MSADKIALNSPQNITSATLLPITRSSSASQPSNAARRLPNDHITIRNDIMPMLDSTLAMIQTVNLQITDIADEIVLLCGRTGSGKSTLMNLLAGEQLTASKQPNTKAFLLEGGRVAQIGHNASQTQIPQKVQIGQTQYWDCPGFGDTRGTVIDISNSFSINKLLSTPNRVKIIAVIPESDLIDRAQDFRSLISSLCDIFENKEDLTQSLCIVFTKVRDTENIENFKRQIQKIIDTDTNLAPSHRDLMLKIISNAKIAILDWPMQSGPIDIPQDIIAQIATTKFMYRPKTNIVVSKESLAIMQRLVGEVDQRIGNSINTLTEKVIHTLDRMAMPDLNQLKDVLTLFKKTILTQTRFENNTNMVACIRDDLFIKMLQMPCFEDMNGSILRNLNELQDLVGYMDSFFKKILPDISISISCMKLQDGEFISNIESKIENKITIYALHKAEEKIDAVTTETKHLSNELLHTRDQAAKQQADLTSTKSALTQAQADVSSVRQRLDQAVASHAAAQATSQQQQAQIVSLTAAAQISAAQASAVAARNNAWKVPEIGKRQDQVIALLGQAEKYIGEGLYLPGVTLYGRNLGGWDYRPEMREIQRKVPELIAEIEGLGARCAVNPARIAAVLRPIT